LVPGGQRHIVVVAEQAELAHRQKPGAGDVARSRGGVFDSLLVYTVERPVIGTITLSATLGALFFGVTFVKMSDRSDHLTLAVVLGVVGVALGLFTGLRIAKRGLPNLDRQIRDEHPSPTDPLSPSR
jgi:hypothetical protein